MSSRVVSWPVFEEGASMEPLAAAALRIAQSQLGVKEDPPGSNRGRQIDEYLMSVGLDPTQGSFPWCASFVCWCVREAAKEVGGPPIWQSSASVLRLFQRNFEHLEIDAPEPGCVFVHLVPNGNGKGHTGFVTSVGADGSLHTIEGNTDERGSRTGGQVIAGERPAGYAKAWLRVA